MENVNWWSLGLGILGTWMSVAVTMLVAVWVHRMELRSAAKKDAYDREKRRRQLLVTLHETLKDNLEKLEAMERCLPTCPAQDLDLAILDSTAALKYELVSDDVELCRIVDRMRDLLRMTAANVAALERREEDMMTHLLFSAVTGGAHNEQLAQIRTRQIEGLKRRLAIVIDAVRKTLAIWPPAGRP